MATNNQKLESLCGLILEAGFTSVNQMLQSLQSLDMPGGFLTTGNFENDQKWKDLQTIFYMVGDKITTFPQMFQSKYSKDQQVIANFGYSMMFIMASQTKEFQRTPL